MFTSAAIEPRRVSTTSLVLAGAAVAAWGITIAWIRAEDMGAMPGTMGMGVVSFTVMWGLMMAAMMLPSVAPFVRSYQATVVQHRASRLFALPLRHLGVLVRDRSGRLRHRRLVRATRSR